MSKQHKEREVIYQNHNDELCFKPKVNVFN